MPDLTDRAGAALVVGGTGGIGAAIARLLADRGARVALTYRANAGAAADLVKTMAGGARPWRLDVTDDGACARTVAEVAEAYGGIHTLCYAAGPHVPMVHLSRVTPEQFRDQMARD